MTDGLVSVITSVYNSGRYISKAVESVLSQTYHNWELLITDDCSTDNSPDILAAYAARDSRIRLFHLNENSGPGVARNLSLANARGQYIAFLDIDDMWMPDKLERQLDLMKRTGCGMVYSSYLTCDDSEKITGIVRCKSKIHFWRIVCDNAIGCLTMMFDRNVTGDVYFLALRKRQDWGMNIELLRRCRIAYGIKDALAVYRVRKGSVSRYKLSLTKYNVAIYKQVLGYSGMRAVLTFVFIFMPFYIGKKTLQYLGNIFFWGVPGNSGKARIRIIN